jgi:hypothetical protein
VDKTGRFPIFLVLRVPTRTWIFEDFLKMKPNPTDNSTIKKAGRLCPAFESSNDLRKSDFGTDDLGL